MDLYVLDSYLDRETVVDWYDSLIWTERHSAIGDFELTVRADRTSKNLFAPDRYLGLENSYRVMCVETVEETTDSDGAPAYKVSGRSIERLLEDRIAMPSLTALKTRPHWEIGPLTPGNIMRKIFTDVCVSGVMSPDDILPMYTTGSFLPHGSIVESDEELTIQLTPGSVYEGVKQIADMFNLGFRLVRNPETGLLHFDVYTGDDRTSSQQANKAVIFSPELDNLSNTSSILSKTDYYNVAYVFGLNGAVVVSTDDGDDATGFQRRVLTVNAEDITTAAGPALTQALEIRGRQELSAHRIVQAFDGEIPQHGGYTYGSDYNLGDLVEKRSADGEATNLRVTEQIFVSDPEGVRSYPTLAIDQLITPGSWYSWAGGRFWDDALGTWIEA